MSDILGVSQGSQTFCQYSQPWDEALRLLEDYDIQEILAVNLNKSKPWETYTLPLRRVGENKRELCFLQPPVTYGFKFLKIGPYKIKMEVLFQQ